MLATIEVETHGKHRTSDCSGRVESPPEICSAISSTEKIRALASPFTRVTRKTTRYCEPFGEVTTRSTNFDGIEGFNMKI